MKKQILIYALFTVIGFVLYPLICRHSPEPIQVVNPVISGPSAPDTVFIDKYLTMEITKYIQKIIKDTVIVKQIIRDTNLIWNPPYYLSRKLFEESYYKSDLFAWGLAPVDSFKLIQDINWNKYMLDVYKPIMDDQKRKSNLTYLTIGTLTGISLTSIAIVLIK